MAPRTSPLPPAPTPASICTDAHAGGSAAPPVHAAPHRPQRSTTATSSTTPTTAASRPARPWSPTRSSRRRLPTSPTRTSPSSTTSSPRPAATRHSTAGARLQRRDARQMVDRERALLHRQQRHADDAGRRRAGRANPRHRHRHGLRRDRRLFGLEGDDGGRDHAEIDDLEHDGAERRSELGQARVSRDLRRHACDMFPAGGETTFTGNTVTDPRGDVQTLKYRLINFDR